MSFQFTEDMHNILDSLMINLDCRIVILRAKGKVFCAGLDLAQLPKMNKRKLPEELKQYSYIDVPEVMKKIIYLQYRLSELIKKMRKILQPIIVAVQGAATGGGFALTLASDFRIATPRAKFNNAFIKIGLSGSDVGTSYFPPRLIGMSRAAEILYTGRFINAEEAENIGLVLKIVEENELMSYSTEFAKNLLEKSPLGLRMTKEAINISMDSPSLQTILQLENRTQALCAQSKDAIEGGLAFFQKRKPHYPPK